MAASAVPAAFRAVVSALTANLPTGTAVIPGPALSHPNEMSYVEVGCDDSDTLNVYSNAVSGSQAWAQLGGGIRDETFTIHCIATAWNGDNDCLAAMDAVYLLMAGIEAALIADPRLGGASGILWSPGITSAGMKFIQDTKGAGAKLAFDIECKSRN